MKKALLFTLIAAPILLGTMVLAHLINTSIDRKRQAEVDRIAAEKQAMLEKQEIEREQMRERIMRETREEFSKKEAAKRAAEERFAKDVEEAKQKAEKEAQYQWAGKSLAALLSPKSPTTQPKDWLKGTTVKDWESHPGRTALRIAAIKQGGDMWEFTAKYQDEHDNVIGERVWFVTIMDSKVVEWHEK